MPHKGVLSPWEKLNMEWGLNRWYCRWFKYVEEVESIFGVAINLAGSVPRKMVYVLLSLFILFMLDQSRSLITVAHKRESKLWHPTHTLIPIRLYVLESKTDSVKSIPGFISSLNQSKMPPPLWGRLRFRLAFWILAQLPAGWLGFPFIRVSGQTWKDMALKQQTE